MIVFQLYELLFDCVHPWLIGYYATGIKEAKTGKVYVLCVTISNIDCESLIQVFVHKLDFYVIQMKPTSFDVFCPLYIPKYTKAPPF